MKIKRAMTTKNQGRIISRYSLDCKRIHCCSSSKFSKERLAQFRNLSERPDIYELLSNAIGKSVVIGRHVNMNLFDSAEHFRS
jgi:DNA replicative helicase MCM subunit Mcm2 (Cdc46/Mcm family)